MSMNLFRFSRKKKKDKCVYPRYSIYMCTNISVEWKGNGIGMLKTMVQIRQNLCSECNMWGKYSSVNLHFLGLE